jgi:hypothetical protein
MEDTGSAPIPKHASLLFYGKTCRFACFLIQPDRFHPVDMSRQGEPVRPASTYHMPSIWKIAQITKLHPNIDRAKGVVNRPTVMKKPGLVSFAPVR